MVGLNMDQDWTSPWGLGGWSGMDDHGDLFGDFRMELIARGSPSVLSCLLYILYIYNYIYIYVILVGGLFFKKKVHSFPFSW
jgi:hypothetical protein